MSRFSTSPLAQVMRPGLAVTALVALPALAILAGAFGGIQPVFAQAGDPVAGRQKAQACSVCHGQLGLSSTPDAPNLAAQPALYTAAQLRAYRDGERKHEVMSIMSKALSDADIDNLSAWYASLQVEVKQAP